MTRMQREHGQEPPPVRNRYPEIGEGMEIVGIFLIVLLMGCLLWYSRVYHFSLLGVVIATWSLGAVVFALSLISEVRKLPQIQLVSLWNQHPKALKRLGQLVLCVGFVLMLGDTAFEQAQGYPESYFPWNLIFGFIELLICLIGVVLYLRATRLLKRSHYSS